ncbi:hypothetical protein AYI70_g484 [Smittium culicis]|uniref:Lipoprotein n=1 Tax=Smittium culicis TaxID=133412 RepID=A0A1R1YGM9_9FUNG|nr:hypothetical protein AYI70_g484 [Smittium culicis]
MLKNTILYSLFLASISCVYSQIQGRLKTYWSVNYYPFAENASGVYDYGNCANIGTITGLRVISAEDAEVSIFSGPSCSNLLDKKKLCGAYANKNLIGSYGSSIHISLRVNRAPGICKYKKKNEDCD